ncbi:MAG: methyltransferase domain-containing protein [Promethearchaeota archaeon]
MKTIPKIENNIKKQNSTALETPKSQICLGPVLNLEEYVRKDWWNHLFNAYYLKTDGDVVNDDGITSKEVDIFSEIVELKTDYEILDLCCGQGRHSLELARRGFSHIYGIDRSRYLIQRARRSARKELLNIEFRIGDARKLPYASDKFDIVFILGNSFGYFDNINDDLLLLKEIKRVLKPWGRILIDLTDGEYLKKNFQARSWEWIDKNLFVCRERSLSLDKQKLISREVINHVNEGVLVDQFYAERLYSRSKISDLIDHAGFCDVQFHREISPNSRRNQDLGMMEKRLIVSAQVRKEWTHKIQNNKQIPKTIIVLLGDPNKPDVLKPSKIFDDDDFYTIDKLKGALRDMNGKDFIFLNNHDTLINDLIKLKGKIHYVLNLCDEGYYNHARNELHIPALLDLLKIPYSGSGPQCLAFCYDKSLVRGIAKEMDIPVPEAIFIKPGDIVFDLPLYFPALVKPNYGDSSFGITKECVVYNGEELISAISKIRESFGYSNPILIEQFLTGKDLTLGIIGNPPGDHIILPIAEEDYSQLPPELPKICGYEAKWLPDSPYCCLRSIPADLPEKAVEIIETCSLKLFERLECKDYARFDWRLDSEGNPKLLEVNPNPGWCWDGHLAKMANFMDLSYKQMLEEIIKATEMRLNDF